MQKRRGKRSRSFIIWVGIFAAVLLAAVAIMLTQAPGLVGSGAGR